MQTYNFYPLLNKNKKDSYFQIMMARSRLKYVQRPQPDIMRRVLFGGLQQVPPRGDWGGHDS